MRRRAWAEVARAGDLRERVRALRGDPAALGVGVVDDLAGHLRDAGLAVASVRRVGPGEPLHAVVAHR